MPGEHHHLPDECDQLPEGDDELPGQHHRLPDECDQLPG